MKYFDTLPKIVVYDNNGVATIATNLLARCSIIPQILQNPMVFYKYDIQDGDTPEIIAYKYYGDSYRYWIVLFSNQILDPQWEWPLNYKEFDDYINDKYVSNNIDPYGTIDHYEKVVTTTDLTTGTVTTNTIIVDETTYNTILNTSATYAVPTGNVTVTISKNAVSIYQNELNLNEAKRSINLLNTNYVNTLETQLKNLLN